MFKVVITPKSYPSAGENALKTLEAAGCEININKTGKTYTEEQMIELCKDADGLIVGVDPVTEKVLKNSKLKAVSKYGAGLDNIDLNAAKELGIEVKAAAGSNSTSVAELAIGLCFSIARNIPYGAAEAKKGGWDRIRGVELTGKTMGVLGFGGIGRETGRMAKGLGMKVFAYDPFVTRAPEGVTLASIDEVVKNADFISVHIPLLDNTHHLINAELIGKMKDGAYLINTSRGELVDEDSLLDALKSGKLAGAASDVFSKEPPETDNELLNMKNFILTPHIGAFTAEANVRMADISADNLIQILNK